MNEFSQSFNLVLKGKLNVSDILQSLDKVEAKLEKFKLPDAMQKSFDTLISKIRSKADDVMGRIEKGFHNMNDVKGLVKDFGLLEDNVNNLNTKIETTDFSKFETIVPSEELEKIKRLGKEIAEAAQELAILNSRIEEIKNNLKSNNFSTPTLEGLKEELVDAAAAGDDYTGILQKMKLATENTQDYIDANSRTDEVKRYQRILKDIQNANDKISVTKSQIVQNASEKQDYEQRLATVNAQISELEARIAEAKKKYEDPNTAKSSRGGIKAQINRREAQLAPLVEQRGTLEKGLKSTQTRESSLDKTLKNDQSKINALQELLQSAKKDLDEFIQGLQEADVQKLNGLSDSLSQISDLANQAKEGKDKVDELGNELQEAGQNAQQIKSDNIKGIKQDANSAGDRVDSLKKSLAEVVKEANGFNDLNNQIGNVYNNLLRFFSLENGIQVFKRAVNGAFDAVKELDAAMTEIAVVSDFSIDDMWAQLPQFTQVANELGVSIRDVYDATTLYIQQGLDLSSSMQLSIETLKMARIAGMEASNATDAMTSALRGFNMELNQTSGQRINDVYSELAAISASDTQEIATAMSKVASLAHSANMEFEITAALLAQGVEVTREAPETIGTALKTIIGRFGEVKKLFTEGQITGEDTDGEIIDVNKLQTALRTANISMTDFLLGKEGLDQVFLRLSEKWDDLTVLQQRYISTMAAGSRLNVN